jgi:hypothetical protein
MNSESLKNIQINGKPRQLMAFISLMFGLSFSLARDKG